MKWTRHRCQAAPARTLAPATLRPSWASEITKTTPFRPRRTSERRKAVQKAWSSLGPDLDAQHLAPPLGARPRSPPPWPWETTRLALPDLVVGGVQPDVGVLPFDGPGDGRPAPRRPGPCRSGTPRSWRSRPYPGPGPGRRPCGWRSPSRRPPGSPPPGPARPAGGAPGARGSRTPERSWGPAARPCPPWCPRSWCGSRFGARSGPRSARRARPRSRVETSASINTWARTRTPSWSMSTSSSSQELAHERGDVHPVLGHLPPPRRLADIGEDGRWPSQFKDGRSESPPRAGRPPARRSHRTSRTRPPPGA